MFAYKKYSIIIRIFVSIKNKEITMWTCRQFEFVKCRVVKMQCEGLFCSVVKSKGGKFN